MSYSMLEPDWPLECECRYDEAHDRIDREDCSIHAHLDDEVAPEFGNLTVRKNATAVKKRAGADAA